MELSGRLLGGEDAELVYTLGILDHFLVGFTAKRPSEFQFHLKLLGRHLGGKAA